MANRNRRKELIDSVRSLETRRGESPTGNIVNTKAQDVAGTTPARPKRGRTTLRREVRETDLRDVFKKDPEFFKQEDVTKPGTELLKTFKQQEATDVSRVQPPGVAPKGAGIGVIKRTQTPFSAFETSGQSKRTRERLGALGKLKPGESIDNFSIAQTSRGGTKRRKSPGIFTAKGMEGFFGNLGALAQKIVSPEFQSQLATQASAASTRRGQRADTKAKTERIKALSSTAKDIRDTGDNEELASALEDQIQKLIGGGGDPVADFLESGKRAGLSNEVLKEIIASIQVQGG